jgi:hypothetical protein
MLDNIMFINNVNVIPVARKVRNTLYAIINKIFYLINFHYIIRILMQLYYFVKMFKKLPKVLKIQNTMHNFTESKL